MYMYSICTFMLLPPVAHVSTPPPVTPHLPPPWWSSQSSGREAQYWEHDELAVVASDGWALHNGTRPGWVATHRMPRAGAVWVNLGGEGVGGGGAL